MDENEEPPRTEEIHNKPVSGMGRRRFLKTLSAVGFTGASAISLSAEDVEGASSDEVPIVYGYRSDPDDPDSEREPMKNTSRLTGIMI